MERVEEWKGEKNGKNLGSGGELCSKSEGEWWN